jgi:cyclopropane-fatty-acyl-phospholipid synthase
MLDINKQNTELGTPTCWAIERRLLQTLYDKLGQPAIGFRLWDEFGVGQVNGVAPMATIQDRRTFWRLIINPELHFGEDYSRGGIQLQGDLVEFLEAIYRGRRNKARETATFVARSCKHRSISQGKAKTNATHHYDIDNDFYRLWLDDEMVYTCAYFPDPTVSLEQAQNAKMEHICRKLQLKRGDYVIEAGCGWGGLSRYMARHYHVNVRAYNVSHAQIEEATRRARQEGLGDKLEFIEDDYRNITGQCDAFVSIGMLEHVGQRNYPVLGNVIDKVLKENGRGLIHTIAENQPAPTNPWLQRYIFPDGSLPTLREMMDIFEPHDFSIADVENLRLHYAKTLEHWLERFEDHRDEIASRFGEDFVRMWRLYLGGSIANFTTGNIQLYQVLFHRSEQTNLAITRNHLYR